MKNRKDIRKVLIISTTDSFLAKSLMAKLEDAGVETEFTHAGIEDVQTHMNDVALVLFFMNEETEVMPEMLVYLKDTIQDRDLGLFLIGDDAQEDTVKKTIPEQIITECFRRPLDIDALVKKACTYHAENTGEKRKKTVLIVDDDITYMRMIYEWLKDSYHVGMASSGVQAISYLAKNKADLILLDYEMPIADGPQVLSMLKNDSETGQIPVMFLTGHGDRKSVLSVVSLSPVDYLLKTIDRETLLNKLNTFFAKG